MADKLKKADYCRMYILLDNFTTYISEGKNIEAAFTHEDEDIDKMIANGEFDKLIRKYNIEQWQGRIQYKIDLLTNDYYCKNLPEMLDVAVALRDNDKWQSKEQDDLTETVKKQLTDYLKKALPKFDRVKIHGFSTINIYMEEKAYYGVKLEVNPSYGSYNLTVDSSTIYYFPDCNTETSHITIGCMETACYIYNHQDIIKKIGDLMLDYSEKWDKIEETHKAKENEIYDNALDMVYKMAVDLYEQKKAYKK